MEVHHAAGPWQPIGSAPTDPRQLILIEVKDKRDQRSRYMLVHWVRERWVFPDRSHLSDTQVPQRWAVVNAG